MIKQEKIVLLNNIEFRCEICNKAFGTSKYLKHHLENVHRHPDTLKCLQCNFETTMLNSMFRHAQALNHTYLNAIKTRTCDFCDAVLRYPDSFNKHKLKFHKTDNHICPKWKCGVMVGTAENLKNHLKKHHSGVDSQFECLECKAKFKNAYGLRLHKLDEHTAIQKCICDMCNNVFPNIKLLKQHMYSYHITQRYKTQRMIY